MEFQVQKVFFVYLLAFAVNGQNFGGLDNLGDTISASVTNALKPLEGLGSQINGQVQKVLQHSQNIEQDVNRGLSSLDGLGSQISQSVYQGLEPVRAIELNFRLRDGVGGITIATHQPSGKQFIIKNGQPFTCGSQIDFNTGSCSEPLQQFKITSSSPKSDWCYLTNYNIVNNFVCLSLESIHIDVINNQVSCKSLVGGAVIQLTLDDYKSLCSTIRTNTDYRYIPNLADKNHVAIPNQNKYVKCENNENNLCIFNENNELLNTYSGFGGSIFVHNKRTNVVSF
ncbi:uncharacterized protein [Euwallacea fornicatus]|uniref:uncharacterized protein n=1 Tax=Euwallacea fornicatus TaxID=995702 RepID=UPI00338F8479